MDDEWWWWYIDNRISFPSLCCKFTFSECLLCIRYFRFPFTSLHLYWVLQSRLHSWLYVFSYGNGDMVSNHTVTVWWSQRTHSSRVKRPCPQLLCQAAVSGERAQIMNLKPITLKAGEMGKKDLSPLPTWRVHIFVPPSHPPASAQKLNTIVIYKLWL